MMERQDPVRVGGVWLMRKGEHVIVLVEVHGEWREVIREHYEANFSHCVSPDGIRDCPVAHWLCTDEMPGSRLAAIPPPAGPISHLCQEDLHAYCPYLLCECTCHL